MVMQQKRAADLKTDHPGEHKGSFVHALRAYKEGCATGEPKSSPGAAAGGERMGAPSPSLADPDQDEQSTARVLTFDVIDGQGQEQEQEQEQEEEEEEEQA